MSAEGFYGWRIVAYASVALAATGPGQTVGVSLFVDPVIEDLGLTRSAVSTAYLVGTLTGAAALPWIGRALDRYGIRRTMAVIGATFGAVLIGLSTVSGIVGLTVGFIGIRLAGQGALGLVATTAAALWFDRRRGMATGIVSALGAVGISLTPLLVEGLIADHGWRTAWLVEGLAVWVVVVPLALLGMRDHPTDLGQWPDGVRPVDEPHERRLRWGMSASEAMRHPFFWLVTSGIALSGLLGTAVAFHQISLLSAQGLSTAEAAANFVPQTLAALVATLATGTLADHIRPRWLVVTSMLGLALGLAWGTWVSPGVSAIMYGLLIGGAGGSIRALEAATFPRYFGTRCLGAIRGRVAAISVGSTAFGPLLFAAAQDASGTYTHILLLTAPLPLLVAAAAMLIAPPSPKPLADLRREPAVPAVPGGTS